MARRSSWAVGFSFFAGFMLIMIGCFQIIAGLAALVKDDFYVVSPNYFINIDASGWGWIHLIVGAIVLLAGFGIFSGSVAARTVGVVIAVINALVNFAFIPYYPLWSILIIALDVAVIWALTAHGRDIVA